MIICLLGGIGSGKTLSIIKEIVDNQPSIAYCNFRLKKIKSYHRLKFEDIFNIEETKGERGKSTKKMAINWNFWQSLQDNKEQYSVYLDEIHNLVHSRTSMTKQNILMSKWISQIRKILQDHASNNLYIISQTIRKIDVDFRELAQIFVHCYKASLGKKVYIQQFYYEGYENYLLGNHAFKKVFLGNPYFKYYDSTELVRFSDHDEYL